MAVGNPFEDKTVSRTVVRRLQVQLDYRHLDQMSRVSAKGPLPFNVVLIRTISKVRRLQLDVPVAGADIEEALGFVDDGRVADSLGAGAGLDAQTVRANLRGEYRSGSGRCRSTCRQC